MLDAAAQRQFDVLVVHKTDRLARDVEQQAYLRVELDRYGVRVESVRNQHDRATFAGRLVDSFEQQFAEYEVSVIQARMATGLRNRIEIEHRLPGAGHPLFGYQYDNPAKSEKNRYVEDPAQSWIVRRMFEEAAAGVPLRRIAIGLNEDGITTAKGKQWQARQVNRLLANPTYMGRVYANRHKVTKDKQTGRKIETMRPESEWVRIEGAAPALADEATWSAANDVLHRNRSKREATRPYDTATDALLRAGHVYCAYCGHSMAVSRRRGKVSYKCQSVYRGANSECRGWAIEAGKLDSFVWARCESWLGDPGVLAYELERSRPQIVESTADEIAQLQRGLDSIESEQAALAQTLGRLGSSAAEPVIDRLNILGSNREAPLAQREALVRTQEAASQVKAAEASFWDGIFEYVEGIDHWGYEQKRETLKRLSVRVTVAKMGKGRARFWVEVLPPWPSEVERWGGLFPHKKLPGPFDFDGGVLVGAPCRIVDAGSEGTAVTVLSKSVYAAYQRTQTLAAEQERTIDRA